MESGRLTFTEQTFPPNWQALQVYAFYRFILAGALLISIHFNFLPNFIANINEPLFTSLTQAYISFSAICILIAFFKRPAFYYQIHITISFDVLFLVMIMYAGGGILTGLGILLVIVVAAHSILLPGKLALLSAALASTAVLTEQVFSQFTQAYPQLAYPQAGMLGIAIFATSLGLQFISNKAVKNQILAKERGAKLTVIGQLNTHVVSHMHSGVIVFNHERTIEIINHSAIKILGLKTVPHYVHGLPQTLQAAILAWQNNASSAREPRQLISGGPPVKLDFHALGKDKKDVLIFMSDLTQEAKQAQDIKLASLGKLTANIAHELRNPLSAASHAAQLMAESNSLSEDEKYLIDVIYQNCDRMNTVIRNVLSLSAQKQAHPQTIQLSDWLHEFSNEFHATGLKSHQITIQVEPKDITIQVDQTQLRQILVNLFENGLRYSYKNTKMATLDVSAYTSEDNTQVYLDIHDQGEGINTENTNFIFEPFFTTESGGSGLGLYIAKELSEINGAQLNLIPTQTGSLFRITFPNEQGASSWNAHMH